MLEYIDTLPETYDEALYQKFISYYGTHYPFQVTLGGRARMMTVISHAFASQQSDSSITASMAASWGELGGGGGGSSASNTTSQAWDDSSSIKTETVGGDPAINAFNVTTDGQGWANWVKSVEHGAPVVTSMQLEPIWSLVPEGPKQDNVIKAVQAYASNVTWPAANLTQYTMGWCDCYDTDIVQSQDNQAYGSLECSDQGRHEGFFLVGFLLHTIFHEDEWGWHTGDNGNARCCRPCFTAAN